jgi:chaperone required for assembly of F1-ATPase
LAIARESIRIHEKDAGFVLLIDGKTLTSPGGAPITLQSRRLIRALAAELAAYEDIDVSRPNIYCLASTQVDFIDKGMGIQPEHVARIVLLDPALRALPETQMDVLSPALEIVDIYLGRHGLAHPQMPALPEEAIEKWLSESSAQVKQNLEGILRLACDMFGGISAAEHTVLINAGKVHRSFLLGLMLAKGEVSPAEYAAAVMTTLHVNPLAWKNIGTDQYRAACEEVRLQADSMRLFIEESAKKNLRVF